MEHYQDSLTLRTSQIRAYVEKTYGPHAETALTILADTEQYEAYNQAMIDQILLNPATTYTNGWDQATDSILKQLPKTLQAEIEATYQDALASPAVWVNQPGQRAETALDLDPVPRPSYEPPKQPLSVLMAPLPPSLQQRLVCDMARVAEKTRDEVTLADRELFAADAYYEEGYWEGQATVLACLNDHAHRRWWGEQAGKHSRTRHEASVTAAPLQAAMSKAA